MSAPPDHAADRGRVIAGKYELVELAGTGGMAAVWRAVQRGAAGFARTVAVKKMRPEFRAMKNYIDMFIEEARVGAELQHPNVVQVHDFVQDEEGMYYLVMEWVEGIDLGRFVKAFARAGQPTPWPLIASAAIGALRGLAAAHERRAADGTPAPVIHRDVSPHNVMIAVDGIAKLTDFGLARARDRIHSLTSPGTVKGKLSYLAPEITHGKPASERTDIFAMGSVLWEALAGRALFDGPTDVDVFKQIREGRVQPLAPERPDLPAGLVQCVHRALAVAPAQRYPSARKMALDLVALLRAVREPSDAQVLLGHAVTQVRQWHGAGATPPSSTGSETSEIIELSASELKEPGD